MDQTTTYRKNHQLLSSRFPAACQELDRREGQGRWRLLPLKSPHGHYNLKAEDSHGKQGFIYGQEDIQSAAEKLFQSWDLDAQDYVLFIGTGLGYLPLVAAQKGSGGPGLIIIEPMGEIFRMAMQLVDLTPLFSYEHLTLHLGRDAHKEVAAILDPHAELLPLGRNRVITHPNYKDLFGQAIVSLEREVHHQLASLRDIWHTANTFGALMMDNTLANLPSIFRSTPMARLKNIFRSIPAYCIAAGPSLDEALPKLKTIQDQALIIACDSAVSSLVAADIYPHFTVTVDVTARNFKKIRPHLDRLRGSVLIFGPEANPDNVRTFLGRRRIIISADNKLVNRWLDPLLALGCKVPTMTSVSQGALHGAQLLGADPIILVGMDLALSEKGSHSKHSHFQYLPDKAKLISIPATNGKTVFSLPQLVADKVQIEKHIAKSRAHFINTSGSGALIQGTVNLPIDDAVALAQNREQNVGDCFKEVDWSPALAAGKACDLLRTMQARLVKFIDACRKGVAMLGPLLATHPPTLKVDVVDADIQPLNDYLGSFQKRYDDLIAILADMRLDSIRELEKMGHRSRGLKGEARIVLELTIMNDFYTSLGAVAERVLQPAQSMSAFMDSAAKMESEIQSVPADIAQLARLADLYATKGELGPAEQYYLHWMALDPPSSDPLCKLVELFMAYRQWGLAEALLEQHRKRYAGDETVEQLCGNLKESIASLLDTAQNEVKAEHWPQARAVLLEYVDIRPRDRTAQTLLHQTNQAIEALHRLE